MNLVAPIAIIRALNKHFQFLPRSYIRIFSMDSETSWRGVPISEIIGSQSPWGAPEFPLVTPSGCHSVLYHIPSQGLSDDHPLKPRVGEDRWDSDHVRLPCSSKSLYPVENSRIQKVLSLLVESFHQKPGPKVDISNPRCLIKENGEPRLRKRWEMICEALSRPISSSHELADAILSYNTKFKRIWKFTALHALFNEHLDEEESRQFFQQTLPLVAQLALDLPRLVQAPIPLLKQNQNRSISLTQLQAASLLANAFFCTFPRRNTLKRASEYASYPNINFSSLFEKHGYDDVVEKLKFICHYFRRVTTQAPAGVLTLSRRSVSPAKCPRWGQSTRPIGLLPLHVDSQGRIEDAHGLIQVDFANKYLGGGVLGHGSVQEEIRFLICPELMVTMLVTEALRPREAVLIIGAERYSCYAGYSRTLSWRGDYRDGAPRDCSRRRRSAVLAIDALPYSDTTHQYRPQCLVRELNKAWVGVSFLADGDNDVTYPGMATGNWGCGAFGGTPHLKALIQMMSSAQAGRPMAYFTFNDEELRDLIVSMYDLLVRYNVTVGELYHYLMRFSSADLSGSELLAFLHQAVVDGASRPRMKLNHHQNDATETLAETKENEELDSIQRALRSDSPDLFSQESACEQLNKPAELTHERVVDNTINKSSGALDRDCRNFNDRSERSNRNADKHQTDLDSYVRKPNDNKMAPIENKTVPTEQTFRLFEEMQKFDDDNGNLNLNTSSVNAVFSFKPNRSKNDPEHSSNMSTDSETSFLAVNENQTTPNEKQNENDNVSLDEIVITATGNIASSQKSKDLFASDSTEQSSSEIQCQNQNNVDTKCLNGDRMDVSVSPEGKKKKVRKITDYFTKKLL